MGILVIIITLKPNNSNAYHTIPMPFAIIKCTYCKQTLIRDSDRPHRTFHLTDIAYAKSETQNPRAKCIRRCAPGKGSSGCLPSHDSCRAAIMAMRRCSSIFEWSENSGRFLSAADKMDGGAGGKPYRLIRSTEMLK